MRVNGLAQKIDSVEGGQIEVGKPSDYLDGGTVMAIIMTIEGSIAHALIKPVKGVPRQVSFVGETITVEWVDQANVQSATEWSMWTAEAVGRLKDLTPRDLEPEYLRFTPDNEIEVKPRQPLKVVEGSTDMRAPASTPRRQIDEHAGGPEGFDPDAPAVAGNRVEVEIRGLEGREGENVFVAATEQDFDPQALQGKTVRYGDGQYVVKSAELGEQDGQEVVYLRVDELKERTNADETT